MIHIFFPYLSYQILACFKSKDSWEVRVKMHDQVTNPLLTPKGILLTSFGCVFFVDFLFVFQQHFNPKKTLTPTNKKKAKRSQRFLHRAQQTTRNSVFFCCFTLPIICVWGFASKYIEALPATDHGVFGSEKQWPQGDGLKQDTTAGHLQIGSSRLQKK